MGDSFSLFTLITKEDEETLLLFLYFLCEQGRLMLSKLKKRQALYLKACLFVYI